MPGIVRLKRCERRDADGEVVEVKRRHGLRKAGGTGGIDAERIRAGLKSKVGQFGEAPRGARRHSRSPHEAQSEIVDGRRPERFRVVERCELRTSWCDGRKAGYARGGERVED